ncbi:MAG: sulfotransferase [Pseudomonadota bacterium]
MASEELAKLRAVFARIVAMIQEGRPSEAEIVARQILANNPNEPNLTRLLGVALLRQGKTEEAENVLSLCVKLTPKLAAAHEQHGAALAALGRLPESEAALRTALRLDPKLSSAYSKLSNVLALQGKSEDSQNAARRVFELNPYTAQLKDALALQNEGRLEEARAKARDVLRNDPDNANALYILGGVAMAQEAHNDAEALLRRATEVAPDFAFAWGQLAMALNKQRKYEEAITAAQKALSLDPMNPDWPNLLGNVNLVAGDENAALEAFQRAVKIKPTHTGALIGLGHVYKTLGQQDLSIENYRSAAKTRPDMGEIFFSLSNLKTFRFDDDELRHMTEIVDSGKLNAESEVNFCFSLAKSFEDDKDYEKAFYYYQRGNETKRPHVKHDPVEFQRSADVLMQTFSKEFFQAREGWGHDDASPILIVGLPRSGSTLVEQILSSHSAIDGTAELSDLQEIAITSGSNRSDGLFYPLSLLDTPKDVIDDLGREYIRATTRHRQGGAYFTDKLPNNFPHLGFLHLVLPKSKVIDARRHPLDSCFGCFKQLFAQGQPFTYDLFDLAEYYKTYVQLMAHWEEVLPGKVLRVQYEDNVADQEGQARRMIDFLGLEWEDQMTRFYETDRAVKTASSEQVRQPIYSRSVNTWKRYEAHLQDLILDLEDVLEALPSHLDRPVIPNG